MDTQTFLDNLKSYADRFTETSQIPGEFYDFFESNYDVYISATPEEREKIREFVISPTYLSDLYKIAETKEMNPEPFFIKIAEISSDETEQYVDTPMNEMMAKTERYKTKEE